MLAFRGNRSLTLCYLLSRRDLRRRANAYSGLLSKAGDYATFKFQPYLLLVPYTQSQKQLTGVFHHRAHGVVNNRSCDDRDARFFAALTTRKQCCPRAARCETALLAHVAFNHFANFAGEHLRP